MIDFQRGVLYLDIDGVLANLVQAVVDRVNYERGTRWQHNDVTAWGWEPVIKEPDKWWNYTDYRQFWERLPLYPWAHDLFNAAVSCRMPVAFLSSLPESPPEILAARRAWLNQNFKCSRMEKTSSYLVAAERKELVVHRGDLLIDDHEDNIIDVRARGADAWCLAQPWNTDVDVGRMGAPLIISKLQDIRDKRLGQRSN